LKNKYILLLFDDGLNQILQITKESNLSPNDACSIYRVSESIVLDKDVTCWNFPRNGGKGMRENGGGGEFKHNIFDI
jgi:hypothetical protein